MMSKFVNSRYSHNKCQQQLLCLAHDVPIVEYVEITRTKNCLLQQRMSEDQQDEFTKAKVVD